MFRQVDPSTGFRQIDPGFGQMDPGFTQMDPSRSYTQIDPSD
jgi:hypothetical protein